jgi:hypothetical protein
MLLLKRRERMRQGDLFGNDAATNLFGEDAAPVAYRADPKKVREKLTLIVSELRSASSLPWDATRLRYYRTVFPQMSLWLDEQEAAQLRFAFEEEIKRLNAA